MISLPLSASAAVVKNMFEVSLPVASQDRSIRREAFEEAFVEVLVRVSGNSLAATRIDARQASRYVQQYRYLALPESAEPAGSGDAPQHNLWMRFNEGAVKKLLRENALPIWGQQRPNVLVWLAVRDGSHRYILRQQDRSAIKAAFTEEAERRGLPVAWPRMDRRDQQVVSFADVWGAFWGPVLRASQNYGVDAVMIGRMNWQGSSWKVDWSLAIENESQSWKLKALDLELLMASGVDVATDQIASRFSVLEDIANQGELLVQINGVNALESYARAARYLRSLAPVRSVHASQVDAQWVRFRVELTGDRNDLQRIIGLGNMLTPDTPPVPPVTVSAPTPTPPEDTPQLDENGQALPMKPPEQRFPANMLTYRLNG